MHVFENILASGPALVLLSAEAVCVFQAAHEGLHPQREPAV